MSRFGYILIAYVIYVAILQASNTANSIMNKPILALGFWTQWWFVALVFVIAYVSEWLAILAEGRNA